MIPIVLALFLVAPALFFRRQDLVGGLSDFVVRFVGLIIFIGLICGYVDVIPPFWFQVVLTLLLVLLMITAWRRDWLDINPTHRTVSEPNYILVIPGLFFISMFSLAVVTPNRVIAYLLNTWDGSSNAGLVRGMQVAGAIDFSPRNRIGQWSNYPRGAHYVASWIADLIPGGGVLEPRQTALVFVLVIWTIFTLLVIQAGRLVSILASNFGVSERNRLPAVLLSQVLFITPLILNQVLRLHSLAFITALAVSLYALVHCIKTTLQKAEVTINYLFTLSVIFLVATNTYPIAVPIVLISALPLLFRSICFIQGNDSTKRTITIALISTMMISSGCISFLSLIDATNPEERYSLGGHMHVLDLKWIYAAIFTSVLVSLFAMLHNRLAGLVSLSATIILFAMWRLLWILADSGDRTYGLNYYPKKMEYFLLVLLAPVSFSLLLVFKSDVFRVIKTPFLMISWCVAIPIVCIQIYSGIYKVMLKPIASDRYADVIVPIIQQEAVVKGRSIIWDSSAPDISRYGSFLTNYLDVSSWEVAYPDTWELNVILHQQLVGKTSDSEILELCPIVSTDELGPGRIVYLRNGAAFECS